MCSLDCSSRCVKLTAKGLNDGLGAGNDATLHIPCTETRQYGGLNDLVRLQIRQRAFKTIAHFDPHLMFVWRDQQQHAVVLALLAKLPLAEKLVGIRLNGPALQRGNRRHHHLLGARCFMLGELRREQGLRIGGQYMCLIHHPASEGRKMKGSGRSGQRPKASNYETSKRRSA